MAPQPTGFSPFGQTNPLQPAPTGVNPFSTQNGLGTNAFSTNPFPVAGPASNPFPTATKPNPFGALNGSPFASASSPNSLPSTHLNPFPSQTRSISQPFSFASPNQPTSPDLSNTTAPAPTYTFNATTPSSVPARPASTPLTQTKPSPSLKPLKPHQTGSRNPFGVPKAPSPPPVPRAPTLFELANGAGLNQSPSQSPTQVQPQQTGAPATTFTSVASSFLSGSSGSPPVPQLTTSLTSLGPGAAASAPTSATTSTTTGSTFSDSLFGSVGGQPTGSTAFSSQPTGAPLRPQATGYTAGIKAFKPTSSFGATLIDSLPPILQSTPTTSASENSASSPAGAGGGGFGGSFGLSAQPTGFPTNTGTGSSLGVGLRPQATNAGVVNPFRASMLAPGAAGSSPGAGSFPAFGASNASTGASLFSQPTGAPSFGQNLFGGLPTDASNRQNGAASLI